MMMQAVHAARAAELRPFQRGSFAGILADNAGKPTVVNFWSITCPPCLAEMPSGARTASTASNQQAEKPVFTPWTSKT